jgi:hypothetical protein
MSFSGAEPGRVRRSAGRAVEARAPDRRARSTAALAAGIVATAALDLPPLPAALAIAVLVGVLQQGLP